MEDRQTLTAPEGMCYTNGNVYGSQIYLAIGADTNTYYLISEEEYEETLNSKNSKPL